ncbi:hypothetical protein [Chryseolinea sp. H1M3-3]|uniref:hypothetical protein n=1 Tax=Chryseolinea sp. H1M3-3 TaxID=3034144 RepID=UPI0023EB2971|nr:hypothetical protein [Chryseolinea sp. H1M3-3]
MPLKTFVKVGSITNLTDARYCAGMGVDMLGFRTVEGQQNYIGPSKFQEIRGWITGPLIVAEIYGLTNADELTAIIENYKPDYLALGTAELEYLSFMPLPFLLKIDESTQTKNLPFAPAYFISEKPFESSLPLLVGIQNITDVNMALTDSRVSGIVLQGGLELKPGLKDIEVMHEVLESLDED